jgi:hypothetical protein
LRAALDDRARLARARELRERLRDDGIGHAVAALERIVADSRESPG